MLTLAVLLALADPTPLPSKIDDVTLYGAGALVHRRTRAPASGSYVLQGLSSSLDPSNVRVRASTGEIVRVEVRDRVQKAATSERLESLRARLEEARKSLKGAEDELGVLVELRKHLAKLLDVGAASGQEQIATGQVSTIAWEQTYVYAQNKLMENLAAQREASARVEERMRAVRELEREVGVLTDERGTNVRDVLVELETTGATVIDVEYFVHAASWQPVYDLRAAADLSKVDLVYRAQVTQRTGEDWNDVALALSTARPQLGAQGPEPRPIWVSLYDPNTSVSSRIDRKSAPAAEAMPARGIANDAEADAPPASPFATVESQGVNVRFQLPRRESVQSRDDATVVLVGRSSLDVAAERFCAPALDSTVWLRAKTKNTSEWTLLPGLGQVFLGQDFVGPATLALIQPGQELTLHLGADPTLSVERALLTDTSKGPGFLSSRASKVESWRIRVENHGAPTSAKDGAVDVFVREALPRSRDERLEIELTKAEPKPSADERWKEDLEEKGIRTWVLRIPRGEKREIVWETTTSYPKGLEIARGR